MSKLLAHSLRKASYDVYSTVNVIKTSIDILGYPLQILEKLLFSIYFLKAIGTYAHRGSEPCMSPV